MCVCMLVYVCFLPAFMGCMYVFLHAGACVHEHVCACESMRVCVYVCDHAFMFVYMCARAFVFHNSQRLLRSESVI